MISEGFNPNYYQRILELLQSAPLSLSKDLKKYNPYLLSKKVNYQELEDYGIDGAYGYLENSKILVPKTFYNDNHFLHQPIKSLYNRYSYSIPFTCFYKRACFIYYSIAISPGSYITCGII